MKTLAAAVLLSLVVSALLVPVFAQSAPGPVSGTAEAVPDEEKRLDELAAKITFLEEDEEALKRGKAESNGCWLGSAEAAIFQSALSVQAAIAEARREGRFASPALHERFVTRVVDPFVRVREKVRRDCDHRKTRGAFAEREFFDLMLDEYAAGRYETVVALGKSVPELTPDGSPNTLVRELRRQMREWAEEAAGRK